MRRLFPLVLVALTAAACSSDPAASPVPGQATPTPVSTPQAAPAPSAGTGSAGTGEAGGGDAALSKDTEAVCDQAAKVSTQFGKTFADDIKLLIDASGKNDQAAKEIGQKTSRDVQSFSYALKDLGTLVDDPAVKKALTGMSKEVTALKGDVRELDADRLAAMSDKIDKACGRQ